MSKSTDKKLAKLRTKRNELERLAGLGEFDLDAWDWLIAQYFEAGLYSNYEVLRDKRDHLKTIYPGAVRSLPKLGFGPIPLSKIVCCFPPRRLAAKL